MVGSPHLVTAPGPAVHQKPVVPWWVAVNGNQTSACRTLRLHQLSSGCVHYAQGHYKALKWLHP